MYVRVGVMRTSTSPVLSDPPLRREKGGAGARFKMFATAQGVSIEIKDKVLVKHHHGLDEKVSAKSFKPSRSSRLQPATDDQIVRLKSFGFKRSKAYYRKRFTRVLAGAIIRREEEKRGISRKTAWKIKTPERNVLGIAREYPDILTDVASKRIHRLLANTQ